MYPLARPWDQQSILPWWLPRQEGTLKYGSEQIETIIPAESPAPSNKKESQSKCKLRPRTRKNPQSLHDQIHYLGQRNVKDFDGHDNITGKYIRY